MSTPPSRRLRVTPTLGNNKFGRRGKIRCAPCRRFHQRVLFTHGIIDFQCEFDDPLKDCISCLSQNIPCGEKLWARSDRSLNAIQTSTPFLQQLGILAQANQRVSWVSGLEGLTPLPSGAPIRDLESSRSPTQHTLPEAQAPFLPDEIAQLLCDDFPSLSSEEAQSIAAEAIKTSQEPNHLQAASPPPRSLPETPNEPGATLSRICH